MRIGDSRSPGGPGVLPLQDFSWVKDALDQQQKACVLAVRIRGRRETGPDGFGHWVEDPETRGDVTGWAMLRSWNSSRLPAAWRATPWPARIARTVDSPDVDGGGGSGGAGPAGEIGPNSRPPSNSAAQAPQQAPQSKEDGLRPEPAQSVTKARTERPVVVTSHADERRNFDFERVKPTVPSSGPYAPGGTVGIIVSSTEDREQRLYFRSTDRRLVAAHGGDSDLGTPVHDVTSEADIDEPNHAYLQTMMRIVRKPTGDLGLKGNRHHSIAWNIGLAQQGEAMGGLIADGTGKRPRLAHTSVRNGGPIDAGGPRCVHQIGASEDGTPIYPAHLSTRTFWRSALSEGLLDGPLQWPTYWPGPGKAPYPIQAFIGWNANLPYSWPRDDRSKRGTGAWALYSFCYFYAYPPGPPDPGPTPETPGPGTPGGDPGGGGPGTPGGDTGGGPGTGGGGDPRGGGGPGGGGVFLPPGSPGGSTSHTFRQASADRERDPRPTGATLVENRVPGFTYRAPWWGEGAVDTTVGLGADHRPYDATQPAVAREEAYGAQRSEQQAFRYAQEPGRGPEFGGSAPGGIVFLPPEVSLRDVGTGFAPVGVTASTAYRVMPPGTMLAFGLPDLSSGAVKTAVTLRANASGELVLASVNSSGVATDLLRVTAAGLVFEDASAAAEVGTGTANGTSFGASASDKVSFHGAAPVVQSTGYSTASGTGRKTLAVGVDSLTDTQDTLATVIDALKAKGLLGA